MNTLENIFVIAITLLSVVGCGVLMWWTAAARDPAAAVKEAGQEPQSAHGKTGHVWDGIEEYNNPMPRWWLWLFILTLVFSVVYLVLYPGLGNFVGTLKWTQIEEHQVAVDAARKALDERLAPLKNATIAELAKDPSAMSLAANLFAANCSTCHGSDARGARGFPNLTDADWLYGGDPETIYQTIANGRNGVMPALGAGLGKQGLNEVTAYVFHLSNRNAPKDWVDAGKTRFDTLCAACHGIEGKGNPALGAPNLTDNIWLHGGDLETITATVNDGRNNQMPAQLPLLGETKVKLLAAYVVSLSGQKTENKAENKGETTAHVQ